MTMIPLILLCILLTFNAILTQKNKSDSLTEEEQFDSWIKSQVSIGTYYQLKNISTDYKLDYRSLERVGARTRRQYYDHNANFQEVQSKHAVDENLAVIGCKIVDNIYRSSLKELRRYFPVRTLYYDNLEFEAGYLIYQIVYKYKIIVEIFHIAYRRYALQNETQIAPTVYMFYLYRKMADIGRTIVHMCNMLTEIRKKYRKHKSVFYMKKKGPFDSSDEDKMNKDFFFYQKWAETNAKKKKKSNKHYAKCAAKKQKQQMNDLCHAEYRLNKIFNLKKEPPRNPVFPLIYGWSNEETNGKITTKTSGFAGLGR